MDFFELVDKRRSVRKFSNETIPEQVIIKALNAAVLSANSSNLQPWEFMRTESAHRMKAHDPSRSVNLLGRLNRLFYQPEQQLPSINWMHDLIS